MSLKVGHIADIHLNGGAEILSPAAERLSDEGIALMKAAEIFIQEECSVVCVNGDIYNAASTPAQRFVFKHFLRELIEAGIQVVILRGNHDEKLDLDIFNMIYGGSGSGQVIVYESAKSTLRALFKDGKKYSLGLHILPHFNASKIALESSSLSELGETCTGLFDNIIEGFRQEIGRHNGPSMVLFHGTVSEARLDNGMIPKHDGIVLNGPLLSTLGVPVRGGHYHTYQEVFPNVVYSGSITLRNYGETGDKGVVIDEWDGTKWLPHRFVSLNPTKRITICAVWENNQYVCESPSEIDGQALDVIWNIYAPAIKGARVRFRYQVKQSDLSKVDLHPVEEFFKNAGVLELKLERDLIIESAIRSDAIHHTNSVPDMLDVWLDSKGLSDKKPRHRELYESVCKQKEREIVHV